MNHEGHEEHEGRRTNRPLGLFGLVRDAESRRKKSKTGFTKMRMKNEFTIDEH